MGCVEFETVIESPESRQFEDQGLDFTMGKIPDERPKRPRALTYSSDQQHQQVTQDQAQSGLMSKLPREVRELIWSFLIGGHLLHIVPNQNGQVAYLCHEYIGKERNTRNHVSCRPSLEPGSPRKIISNEFATEPVNLLPLLLTCRMVYSEAIPILYSDNIFDIYKVDSLAFFDLAVPSHRLMQIRRLNITWDYLHHSLGHQYNESQVPKYWERVGLILETKFTGLRELTIHLMNECNSASEVGRHRNFCTADLDALRGVKATDRFDVYYYFWDDQCARAVEAKGYPFTLRPDVDTPKPDPNANPYSYAYALAQRQASSR